MKIFSKFSIVFVLFFCFQLFGCKRGDGNTQVSVENSKFELKVVDSVEVDIKVPYLIPVDCNSKDERLFISEISLDTIYIIDKKGKLKRKFSVRGEDPFKIGAVVSNIGYLNDSCIVVSGTRGYMYYTMSGKVIRVDKVPNYSAFLLFYKLRSIKHSKDSIDILSNFRVGFLYDEVIKLYNTKKYYEKAKLLTTYNTKTKQSKSVIGFEEKSIFRQFDKDYSFRISPHFEVDTINSYIYVLINPDPTLYIYDIKTFKLINQIPLGLEHFALRDLPDYGSDNLDYNKLLAVNSEIKSLNIFKDTLLVTYSSGVDSRYYEQMKNKDDMLTVWKKYNKYYMKIYTNGIMVTNDIALPVGCNKVGFVNHNGLLFMSSLPSIMESENTMKFYICKLNRINL